MRSRREPDRRDRPAASGRQATSHLRPVAPPADVPGEPAAGPRDLARELGRLREQVQIAVELESQPDFAAFSADPEGSRAMLLEHLPQLEEHLKRWGELLEQTRLAPGAVWGWLSESCPERGIREPPVAVGALVDRLAVLIVSRARNWLLDSPHELSAEIARERGSGSVVRLSLYVEQQRVATIAESKSADAQGELSRLAATIQALFDDAQRSRPARAIEDLRDAVLELKHELLEELA